MPIHRKRGRPRREEDASIVRKTLRIPTALWKVIEAQADKEGINTHAWMRSALAEKAGFESEEEK